MRKSNKYQKTAFQENFLKNLTSQLALYSGHENEYTISVMKGDLNMKKWIFSMILVLIIVLSACTEETNKVDITESEKVAADADQNGETVTVLMNIQMEMIQTIRKHLEVVTSYERSEGTGDHEAAVKASNRIANELRGIEIAESLNSNLQGDMKESIELLAVYFEERAAALAEESEMDEMDAALQSFHEKIGETFESAGLHAPNFEKDLQ